MNEIDRSAYAQPVAAGPRPTHPMPTDGGLAETNALVQASYVRRLSDAEGLRLAALTWTSDPAIERARVLIARHPDLIGIVPSDQVAGMETYEARRAAAVAAGRSVTEPGPAVVADVDHWAQEYRETEELPEGLTEANVHRAAFQACVQAPDFDAALRRWALWLADLERLDAFHRRRAIARAAFGQPDSYTRARPPRFVDELTDAVGGASIASMIPPVRG